VMVAAGLVARKARALGMTPKPWVKTSLAPGSRVVERYLESAGLLDDLDSIGFNIVGFGCTTCIGNSGPLREDIAAVVREEDLAVVSVLSGNRNFEGRVSPDVKANYLMSPPLVVAYSFAGTIDIDLANDPIGQDSNGNDVFLKDVWPSQQEIADMVEKNITREMFTKSYASVFEGDEKWKAIEVGGGQRYQWNDDSTYVKKAPFFEGMKREAPETVEDLNGLKCLALLGDSVTTDHISPAGSIKAASPAGEYLINKGVTPHMFNSYGARRGNDEVMVRGTFGNIRLRNQLAPGTEGGYTTNFLTGEVTSIYEASMAYQLNGIGLVILAGKEYGTGSSRDWAAKGTRLLGVKAVFAESFERIHRSNLVGMGVLPMQYLEGQTAKSLGLTGQEEFSIIGLESGIASRFANGNQLHIRATTERGDVISFDAICRIDTPTEMDYYRHGGVLQYVLRGLLS
jgi:aconitate hydratase